MGASELTEQVRKRIVGLIAEDRADGKRLLTRLREFRKLEGVSACSAAVHLLAHLDLREDEAEHLLVEILEHREDLQRTLNRDPGLRVAAIDLLSNVKSLLRNPTIVELSQLERTERSAITDDLTGLHNRRYFNSALDVEIRRSRRYVLPLSVLMLDLDAFKSVNDLYGHPFGDLVLQLVGQVMRRAVRESDLACRVGGEEFSVVLPETDRLGAYAVAERIRRTVEATFTESPIGGRIVTMTVSGGVAAYPEDGDDPTSLVARADQALYRSKTRGRNRVVIFHSERRRAIRYPVRPRVSACLFAGGKAAGEARAVNLSTGGAFLEIRGGGVRADPVELRLERSGPGKSSPLVVAGRIVRVEPSRRRDTQGVALSFEQPLSEQRLLELASLSKLERVAGRARE